MYQLNYTLFGTAIENEISRVSDLFFQRGLIGTASANPLTALFSQMILKPQQEEIEETSPTLTEMSEEQRQADEELKNMGLSFG